MKWFKSLGTDELERALPDGRITIACAGGSLIHLVLTPFWKKKTVIHILPSYMYRGDDDDGEDDFTIP